jgi:type VI secretion system secreted protein Hcp
MILVQAVDALVDIPKNPQTGLPAGKRVHQGITLTKEIDKSSPKLYQALTSGEQLKTVTLEFYRISPKGTEEKYYTITLSNAVLVSARTWVPNVLNPEFKQMGHMEDLGLTYEKIVWTWLPDGIEAEDSWLAPKA